MISRKAGGLHFKHDIFYAFLEESLSSIFHMQEIRQILIARLHTQYIYVRQTISVALSCKSNQRLCL